MKLNFESYQVKINPSITNDYVSPEKAIFEKKYRKSTIFFLVITLHAALI
jgi:hypothetical protein